MRHIHGGAANVNGGKDQGACSCELSVCFETVTEEQWVELNHRTLCSCFTYMLTSM